MAERFGFACFLFQPTAVLPASAMDGAAASLPDRIGNPAEVMVLDVQSNNTTKMSWPAGGRLLQRLPHPNEIFFTYYTSVSGNLDCVCLSFQSLTAAILTVSLEDMAIAGHTAEVADSCLRLRNWGLGVAADCLVAGGGEVTLDPNLETPQGALDDMMHPHSLAKWIAFGAAALPMRHVGFSVARRVGSTCILTRD